MKTKTKTKIKTASERYQKKTPYEHIIDRPDTYIGGTDVISQDEWVFNDDTQRMEEKEVNISPGLLKICDEIFVNAADAAKVDDMVSTIKITIDKTSVSVWNDSKGIPVEMHEKHKMWIPEMIFGELLSGENFDDEEMRLTGGRNGYGATLSAIFSNKFAIDIGDIKNHKRYVQEFTNNKLEKTIPKITNYSKKKGYVSIQFEPDFDKFEGMTEIDNDAFKVLQRRSWEIAACTRDNVKVYFNGKLLTVRTFEKFMHTFIGNTKEQQRVFIRLPNEKKDIVLSETESSGGWYWDVGLTISDYGFRHISFVNGVHTSVGGTHVDYICNRIVNKLKKLVEKKKGRKLTKNQIQEHLWIFLNATVVNPKFSSQTKENCILPSKKFQFECSIPDKFIEDFERKCHFVSRVIAVAAAKDITSLSKTDGKKRNRIDVDKLIDAEDAGTSRTKGTCLILTEGDSAKTLAVTGLRVIGRKKYGVFPLKGKCINPTGVKIDKLLLNTEYINLKKILGLQEGQVYKDASSLRYESIMLMMDQDPDGSHIKGLLINLLGRQWPSLLEIPGFLKFFITPLVRARRGNHTEFFFIDQDFDKWKEERNNNTTGWEIDYFKG